MMPEKRFLSMCVVLLFFVGACATTPKDPMERLSASQLQEMGEKYLAAGNLAQALQFLTLANQKDPNNPMILYELGLAYDERGLSDQALNYYQAAIKLKPDFSDVYNAMGRLYASRDQLDKAEAAFKQAFNNPFYALPQLPLFNLGLVSEKRNDLPNALFYYQEALRILPSYGAAHYRMGKVLEAMGRTDEARRSYGKAIQYSPEMAEAHSRYGVLSYNAGDLQAALYSLNRVNRLAPNSDMAEEAKRVLVQLQSIMGPGMQRGGMMYDPERLAGMDIVTQQDLAFQGRGLTSASGTRMLPPPKGMGPVPQVPLTIPPRTVSPKPETTITTPPPTELAKAPEPVPAPPVKDIPAVPEPAPAPSTAPATPGAPAKESAPAAPVIQESVTKEAFSVGPENIVPHHETQPTQIAGDAASGSLEPSKQESRQAAGRSRWAYIVQVGSFLDKENAEGVRKKLEKKGYNSVVKPFNHPSKGSIYVVQLSPVEDGKEASSLLTRIEGEEKLKPLIIKVPAGE